MIKGNKVRNMYRKTYVLINCDTLKANIKEITSKYDYKYYIGVVKANAYGHGDYIVNSLIEGGVNYLAASSLEECLSIRSRNKDIPILCLEPINLEYLDICEKENITITLADYKYFEDMDKHLKLKVHLKIDSGMNRLGFKDKEEVKKVYDEINVSDSLYLEGIYTHFATSGIWDEYWDKQLSNFKDITSLIKLDTIPIVHTARSLTLVNHPKLDFVNGVRLGIIMYGFAQSLAEPKGLRLIKRNMFLKNHKISPVNFSNDLKLKTAFSLRSEIMTIKKVKAYEFVGYGAKYKTDEDILVGIMPIGFADGLIKQNEGRCVKIGSKYYPIIGEIGMDMTAVKIDEDVKLHDEVIIYEDIRKDAKELGISAYQLFTFVTNRVPRVYIENGKKMEIKY